MYGSSALRTLAIFLALSDALCFTPSLFLKHGQRHLQLARVAARIQNRQHAQLRMEADDQAVEGKPVILVARDVAIARGPPQREEQRQYYEEQPAPMGEMQMSKSGINTMVLVSGAVAAVAGGYFGVKSYKARQQSLVEEFGYSMMMYWGDAKTSQDTVKEYFGKVGPVINMFHKPDMYREYCKRLAQDKALGLTSLRDFAAVTKMMGVSSSMAVKQIAKAAEELVPYPNPTETWERNANKPSVLGKLLWLTERCFPDPMAIQKLRSRFPRSYNDDIINVLQNTLTEQAYKDILNANGGPENGLQPGYEELGLARGDAEDLIAKILEEKRLAEEEAARIAAEKAEEERVLKIREAAWKGQQEKMNLNDGKIKTHGEEPKKDEPVQRAEGTHEYECTVCGYTLFVAKGREFKFFGDNFKCPQCGASKQYFKDNAAE